MSATRGILTGLTLQLSRAGRVIAHQKLPTIGSRPRRVTLRVRHHPLSEGTYDLALLRGHEALIRRAIHLH